MNSKTEVNGGMLDSIMLAVALLVVIGAMVAFYMFPDQSKLLRVGGILISVGIACAIGYQTSKGKQFWGFLQDSQVEVRKVVWPTRQETVQTTLIVILVVILIALFLWLLDMFLGWSVGAILGKGG